MDVYRRAELGAAILRTGLSQWSTPNEPHYIRGTPARNRLQGGDAAHSCVEKHDRGSLTQWALMPHARSSAHPVFGTADQIASYNFPSLTNISSLTIAALHCSGVLFLSQKRRLNSLSACLTANVYSHDPIRNCFRSFIAFFQSSPLPNFLPVEFAFGDMDV